MKVKIVGDMPIYVGGQSADVWAHQELFELTPSGAAANISGVPPDAFSETGQLWGSPLYDWPVGTKTAYIAFAESASCTGICTPVCSDVQTHITGRTFNAITNCQFVWTYSHTSSS